MQISKINFTPFRGDLNKASLKNDMLKIGKYCYPKGHSLILEENDVPKPITITAYQNLALRDTHKKQSGNAIEIYYTNQNTNSNEKMIVDKNSENKLFTRFEYYSYLESLREALRLKNKAYSTMQERGKICDTSDTITYKFVE